MNKILLNIFLILASNKIIVMKFKDHTYRIKLFFNHKITNKKFSKGNIHSLIFIYYYSS